MKPKTVFVVKEWLFIITVWLVISNLSTLMMWAMRRHILLVGDWAVFNEYIQSPEAIFEGTSFGLAFGIFFSIIHSVTETPALRKKSFSTIILIKSSLYLVGLLFTMFTMMGIYHVLGLFPENLTPKDLLLFFQWEGFCYGPVCSWKLRTIFVPDHAN